MQALIGLIGSLQNSLHIERPNAYARAGMKTPPFVTLFRHESSIDGVIRKL